MNNAQIVSAIIALLAIIMVFRLYNASQCCDGKLDRSEERKIRASITFMIMTAIAQLYAGIGDTPIAFIWLKGVSMFSIFNEWTYLRTLDKYR